MNQRIGLTDGDNGAGAAMTLASIAYCTDIKGALGMYAPGWSLAWQPDAAVNGNLAYIAYNERADQYAVAVRGSLLNFSWGAFDNWFEQDFNIFIQDDWVYPSGSQGIKISRGSSDGLNDLSNLAYTDGCVRTTMLDFLLGPARGAQSILVTGHSLGGNLATVFAPWLLYQLQQANAPVPPHFPVMTFAAPPAGNTQFAAMFDSTFPASWRYYNTLDIVPMASVPLSIAGMGLLYYPEPQASQISVTYEGHTVTLSEAFDAIALLVGSSEIANDFSFYSQTNVDSGSVPLNPGASVCPVDTSKSLAEQWFTKAGCEHGHETYLSLLGASPVDCAQAALTP